ncbi:MAG: TIGR00730 family Rossman fold protein [Sporolactobacillus sp.]
MKNVAVYCGASTGKRTIYQESAIRLGQWIAGHHYHLVYGGGKVGLMGIIARTVLSEQGLVTGIIPKLLVDRELAYEGLSTLLVVDDMAERKKKMMTLADCCIALPGGPGTLEEIAEAISWARLGENSSPCIFYNVNHYYDSIILLFDKMTDEGFLTGEDREKILVTDSLSEIETFIESYTPPKVRQYAGK